MRTGLFEEILRHLGKNGEQLDSHGNHRTGQGQTGNSWWSKTDYLGEKGFIRTCISYSLQTFREPRCSQTYLGDSRLTKHVYSFRE